MIQIGKSGVGFSGSSHDLAGMRQQFDREFFLRLPKLLDFELLEDFYRQINNAGWYERAHGHIGVESCLEDKGIIGLMNFLLNDQELFRILQDVTGCGRIGSFAGRVYRLSPNSGHYDSWHSDDGDHRMVALSLNLTREIYDGGVLQIREKNLERIHSEVANTGFGDAIVFRLAPNLVHRVTEVTGSASKTAFAGWFKSQPDFLSTLKKSFQPAV